MTNARPGTSTQWDEQNAHERIGAAGARDVAADARDLTARSRDQASAARSRVMAAHDSRSDRDRARPGSSAQIAVRAREQRRREHDRARAADYRSLADEDHRAAALDREHAAHDRRLAGADRDAFARVLALVNSASPTAARDGREAAAEQGSASHEPLRTELRRANRFFDLSSDLMVTASADGYFKSVNPAVKQILGWSAEQFLARPFIDMVHPDDRAATLAEVDKLAEGQVTSSFVNRYEASDGSYRWLDWNAFVPLDEALMYASARDVTERVLAEAALLASERRTRQILESAHDAFIATDDRGVITDWNSQACAAFGWTHDEALGRDLAGTIFPARYRDEHRRGLERFLADGDSSALSTRRELLALRRDGREFPIECTITARQTGAGYAFNAFLRDITERREAEAEIERGRALSELLLRAQDAVSRVFAEAQSSDQAMHGLVVALGAAMGWQLGAWWSCDRDSETLRCRSVWHGGAAAAEFESVTMKLRLARGQALPGRVWATGEPAWTADLASDLSFPRATVAARADLHASVCVPVLADGEFRGAIEFFSTQTGAPDQPTRQMLRTVAEQIGGFMSVLDQRADLVAKLQQLALTDELTGFGNRRAWHEGLERELARARRRDEPLCVAMLDLDHFKRFNDTHGHQAGDELLHELARAWRTQLRASDILARYGGDEFCLALPALAVQAAAIVLERVRAVVPDGQTCSIGLVAFDGAESAEGLVGRADAALYEAKLHGRDRIVIC